MSQIPFTVRHSSLMMLGMAVLLLSGCSGNGGETGGAPGAACQSNCPTAKAGPEQAVVTGASVTLDGSGSTSGTPGLITYQWALTSKPTGSAATLVGATTARPTFTADVAGTYDARLVVQEGDASSAPATVRITCGSGNLAPIADAGPDRTERLGTSVTLDGTGSRDPNGTPITYAWRMVTQPSGSQAVLLNATSKTPSFTPQVAGPYTFALTVSDGALTSPADEVVITVTADNCPPIADAGADQKVTTGQLVTLSGAGSTDPNDNPLTYSWRFQSKPDGSSATLAAATTVSPTFTADMAGLYVLSLVVNDGKLTSAPDTVVVEARLPSSVGGVLQAYVKPSNTTVFPDLTNFGWSVALNGDTLAVGGVDSSCATGVNGNQMDRNCPNSGAVYVFTRNGETWSQQAYLKASNNDLVSTRFGASVSLSGDTLVVGASDEFSCAPGINGNQADKACTGAGAVYVFTRSGSTWSQQAYVKASNPNAHDAFGGSVSVSGNTLAVGAPNEQSCATGINGNQLDNGCGDQGNGAGAVYIFTRGENVWTQEAYLKASNTRIGQAFGIDVSLDGDTLAVGAATEGSCATGIDGDQSNNACRNAGAVYVFTRTGATWTQQAYVKASNTNMEDVFGINVALNGDTLVVGARFEASCASGINGNQLDNGCGGAGAVYIFARTNTRWSQVAYVKPIASNVTTHVAREFGRWLTFDGTTLAVGVSDDSCGTGFNPSPGLNNCGGSGAVYLFTRTATSWAQRAFVKASNAEEGDFFGSYYDNSGGVAIDGNTLAVGAPQEQSCATGINGDQTNNSCGIVMYFDGHSPDPIPARGGVGAVYVYRLQ